MPAKIISEGVFQALFDSIGMGTTWKVLKGRFLTAFRSWLTIIDIWKADTEEDLQKVMEKSESDIAELKARYREAETAYAKENGLFNSNFGDQLIFFHPAAAVGYALVEPLLDETNRADTRRLLQYSGLTDMGMTPEFLKNWIEDEAKIEKQTARATIAGSDGTTQTVDIFSYTDKNDETQNALNALHGLFIAEGVDVAGPEPFTKKDSEELANTIVRGFEEAGIFKDIMDVGKRIKERKEEIIADVVVPSAQTLQYLSEMLSAENIEEFSQSMLGVAKINKSLSSLNPGSFKQNVNDAAEQILNDNNLLADIKKETGLENVTPEQVDQLVFLNARNDFAKSTILLLESVYEENLDLLMKGVTDAGLKKMKETPVGKEYATLIETNIQLLENAIKSLDRLATTGE